MTEAISALRNILNDYGKKLGDLHDADFASRPADGKWSKKEELGHLIDSAHTNLRRFVVCQYAENQKIVYDQEYWVKASGYQQQSSVQLIALWLLMNEQICFVLENMPEELHEYNCDTGKEKTELHTLKWLAYDYVKHQIHHLHHILELEMIAY